MIGAARRRGWVAAAALVTLLTTGCEVSWPPDDPPRFTSAAGARTVVPELAAAASLTAEQRAALVAGEPLLLDVPQTTALDSALRALDGLTITQIATLTASDTTAFADAIQLAANPRVHPAGAGHIVLPDAVETLLTVPPTEPLGSGLHTAARYSWQQVRHSAGPVTVARLDDLGLLAGLLADGTPELHVDTSVDRDLIALAGQLAAAGADRRLDLVGPAGEPLDRAEVHTTVVDLLEVAGRDPEAARAALTGTDMPEGYRAGAVTIALLSHPWAGDEAPLVDLLAAATTPTGQPGDLRFGAEADRVRRANSTTAAITNTLAHHRAILTAIPSAGGHSIGELNPAVTRSLTEAISPRLPGLAGTPRQPIDGVTPLPDADTLAEAFRVLLTDGPSGLYLAAAVDTTERELAVDFGANPYTPINGAVIGRLSTGLRTAIDRQFAQDGRNLADATYRPVAPELPDWVDAAESDTPPLLRADVDRSSTTDRYTAILQGLLLSQPALAADPAIEPFLANGAVRPITDTESATFEAELRAWFTRANLPLDIFHRDLYAEVGDDAWHI